MRKVAVIAIVALVSTNLKAQSFEVQQLMLNVEKLSQFKQILSDMKTGYQIVSKGYAAVRDISQGNFTLHEAFLDGLWMVNPLVRQYWKVPKIISIQAQIVQEYKASFRRFKSSGLFSTGELSYLSKVYGQLFNESLRSLDNLVTILTANKFRMNDEGRLSAIDRIHEEAQEKLAFITSFNNDNTLLLVQRARQQDESKSMKQYLR